MKHITKREFKDALIVTEANFRALSTPRETLISILVALNFDTDNIVNVDIYKDPERGIDSELL